MINIREKILQAEKRIRPYVRETPLEHSLILSKMTGCNVFLKYETHQHTGTFKVRGAYNKILCLTSEQVKCGIVAASSGNHGAAVAFVLHQLNIPGVIFVPENASKAKVDNILQYGVPLEFYGNDCLQTEIHARCFAEKHGMVYISPYNDSDVIAGQGTIGTEISRQLNQIDDVITVGGGGLIAGISSYLKSISPKIQIHGCLPVNSPVMSASIERGEIIDIKTLPTISDATAGGIESGSLTFDLCKKWVDDYYIVSEKNIKNAMKQFIQYQHQLIEGASGLVVASLFQHAKQLHNHNVVLILSGANISIEALNGVLAFPGE